MAMARVPRPALRLWALASILALQAAWIQVRPCAAKSQQASTLACDPFTETLCGATLLSAEHGNCIQLRVDDPDRPGGPRFRVKCWGWGGRGMNGIGPEDYTVDPEQQWTGTWNNRGDEPNEMGDSLPFVDFDFDHDGHGPGSVQLSRTGSNVCAIDGATRELKCFGDPYELGQLGGICRVSQCHGGPSCASCCCLGSKMNAVNLGTNQRAVQVAAGGFMTCVIVEDRVTLARGLKCFGRGGFLGLGHNDDRGDNGGEMGDALPFVDLGAGRHPVQIAAGHSHVCAVLDDGSVKCFGSNSYRACGQPTDSTNTGFGNEPGEMGDDLPSVDLGEGRTAV